MKITWNEISLNKLGRMKKCSEHYEILQIVFPEKDVVNLSIADYRKLTDLTIDLLNPLLLNYLILKNLIMIWY